MAKSVEIWFTRIPVLVVWLALLSAGWSAETPRTETAPTESNSLPQGTVTRFKLEAPIQEIHEIAGGRELLIRLNDPPYWKRFSFTRNEWLPLPTINFSNTYVTGNLSALFVLDRGAAEVRKYGLDDLRPLAMTKLPTGIEYVAILAGCNSQHAPIHVLSTKDAIALSAETLQRRDLRQVVKSPVAARNFKAQPDQNFLITGDGLSFLPISKSSNGDYWNYCSDELGIQSKLFDINYNSNGGSGCGVSGAFIMSGDRWLNSRVNAEGKPLPAKPPERKDNINWRWFVANSPVILQYVSGKQAAGPDRPNRIEFYSYFDSTPFAEIEVPDWSRPQFQFSPPFSPEEGFNPLAFDPYSSKLGMVSADRMELWVQQILPNQNRPQPVLLNWPDTSVARGGEFRFKPVILGTTSITADLQGAQQTPPIKTDSGEVSFTVASDELASLQILTVKLLGNDGSLSYPMPLHLSGPQLPFAIAAARGLKDGFDNFGAGFKSISISKNGCSTLKSSSHILATPVRDVVGPIAGHLILVTDAGHVDFLSLATRQIIRSIAASGDAVFYAGAEALFEYDTPKRTLARIAVPSGERENTITLPGKTRLKALGLGSAPTSPLTLLLEQITNQETSRYGDLQVTTTDADPGIVVLDSRTMKAAGWGQPRFATNQQFTKQTGLSGIIGVNNPSTVLPTSHTGQFVILPRCYLALGRGSSLVVPLPVSTSLFAIFNGPYPPSGSISGTVVSNSSGMAFVGSVSDEVIHPIYGSRLITPCGRYRLVGLGNSEGDFHTEVRALENNRVLFQMARFAIDRREFDGFDEKIPRRMMFLGDHGPPCPSGCGRANLGGRRLRHPRTRQEARSYWLSCDVAKPTVGQGSIDI